MPILYTWAGTGRLPSYLVEPGNSGVKPEQPKLVSVIGIERIVAAGQPNAGRRGGSKSLYFSSAPVHHRDERRSVSCTQRSQNSSIASKTHAHPSLDPKNAGCVEPTIPETHRSVLSRRFGSDGLCHRSFPSLLQPRVRTKLRRRGSSCDSSPASPDLRGPPAERCP